MSEFINVEINMNKCAGINKCGQCVVVCPVSIFETSGDQPFVVEQNQDECTLCDLCLKECTPNAIYIRRLYEH